MYSQFVIKKERINDENIDDFAIESKSIDDLISEKTNENQLNDNLISLDNSIIKNLSINQHLNSLKDNQQLDNSTDNQHLNNSTNNQHLNNPKDNQHLDNSTDNQHLNNLKDNQQFKNSLSQNKIDIQETSTFLNNDLIKNQLINSNPLSNSTTSNDLTKIDQLIEPISSNQSTSSTSSNQTNKLGKTNLNQLKDLVIKMNQFNNKKRPINSIDKDISVNIFNSNFILNWSDRDEIILILNNFTSSLYREKNTIILNKDLVLNRSNELIQILVNLELKLNDDQLEEVPKKKIKKESLEPILIINNELRIKLIDQLICNQNYVIHHRNILNKIDKLNLIRKNQLLIDNLLKLIVNDASNDGELKEHMELEKKDYSTKEIDLIKMINNLKNEVDYIKKLIPTNFSEITLFNYELKDVRRFLDKDNNLHYSNDFNCKINWYLSFSTTINYQTNTSYLGIYLHIQNNLDNKLGFQCKTSFEIRLLSDNKSSKIEKIKHNFTDLNGIGNTYFIKREELFDSRNGYLRDNSIRVQIYLKCGKLYIN